MVTLVLFILQKPLLFVFEKVELHILKRMKTKDNKDKGLLLSGLFL